MLPAKPSTVILNGTITAIAQSQGQNQQYLARILAWARSFGIDPDVFTYNSLIAMSLSTGNGEEAMKLLQQMDKANIQPDAATFAIILNSIFRSETTANMSPKEQNEKVMGVLRNLEAHGLTATPHIYSTLVDGLLRRHGNEAAARAVLDYMVAKKVDIPPHIFTVLMAHYFAHYEYEAIEQLWKQIKVSGVVVDTIFYDRMIERYAAVGDIPKMLAFLKRMSNEGLTPGWPALQQVVVKLAEAGDWKKFEEIVNDVEQGVGIAQKGMRASEDNVISNFWKAVAWKRAEKPKPGDPELSFMQQARHGI
ncbi:putative pentatricopeptide repeat-containing protein [Lasiodiplodia hormozganensis]|uniref:Pentatricopeptide repeat-containing protein n=1 Tax=Lasiodiplodia hormozganensis TaxID=869390 RepID=A0AA39YTC2_9PEZI|nr:putative pentatricopeptide repeat-containing protein [Lasiodiplodia hormozganensis]